MYNVGSLLTCKLLYKLTLLTFLVCLTSLKLIKRTEIKIEKGNNNKWEMSTLNLATEQIKR